MSDILPSLIVPKGSQESFRSAQSQPSSLLVEPVHEAAELPIFHIDNYLNDPKNRALLDPNTHQQQNQGSSFCAKPPANDNSPQPVQLGVKTSNPSTNVVALYHLCQERGLLPEFEIDGNQNGFGGVLRLGEHTVVSEQKWRSKKEAKEGLAEKGVFVVGQIEVKGKSPAAGGGGSSENWIGKLLGMP